MMGILAIILIVLFVIVSLLMSFFVLIQDEQGEGLGGLLGGGGSTSPFGAATNSVLTKITAVLGALFIVFSFGVAFFVKTPDKDHVEQEAKRLQAEEVNGDWFSADIDNYEEPDQNQTGQ